MSQTRLTIEQISELNQIRHELVAIKNGISASEDKANQEKAMNAILHELISKTGNVTPAEQLKLKNKLENLKKLAEGRQQSLKTILEKKPESIKDELAKLTSLGKRITAINQPDDSLVQEAAQTHNEARLAIRSMIEIKKTPNVNAYDALIADAEKTVNALTVTQRDTYGNGIPSTLHGRPIQTKAMTEILNQVQGMKIKM